MFRWPSLPNHSSWQTDRHKRICNGRKFGPHLSIFQVGPSREKKRGNKMGFWDKLRQPKVSAFASLHDNQTDRTQFFDVYFADAKIISDFVGMISRLAFCIFGATYFVRKSLDAGGFLPLIYSAAAVFSLVLASRLVISMHLVIHVTLLGRTQIPRNRIGSAIFIAATYVFGLSGLAGLVMLAIDLSSKLTN